MPPVKGASGSGRGVGNPLVEEMGLPANLNDAVGIVHPVGRGQEVVAGAVGISGQLQTPGIDPSPGFSG